MVAGIRMQKILNALDALDSHNFDRVDNNNCLDTLFSNIFVQFVNMNDNASAAANTMNQNTLRVINAAKSTQDDAKNRSDSVSVSQKLCNRFCFFFSI